MRRRDSTSLNSGFPLPRTIGWTVSLTSSTTPAFIRLETSLAPPTAWMCFGFDALMCSSWFVVGGEGTLDEHRSGGRAGAIDRRGRRSSCSSSTTGFDGSLVRTGWVSEHLERHARDHLDGLVAAQAPSREQTVRVSSQRLLESPVLETGAFWNSLIPKSDALSQAGRPDQPSPGRRLVG